MQIHSPGVSRMQLGYSFTPLRRHRRSQPRPSRQRRHKSWAYRDHGRASSSSSSSSRLVMLQGLLPPALAARASGMRGVKGRGLLTLLLFVLRDRLMILGRSRAAFLLPFAFFFFVVTGLISGFLDRSNVLQVQIFSLARQPAISFVKVAAVGAKGLGPSRAVSDCPDARTPRTAVRTSP